MTFKAKTGKNRGKRAGLNPKQDQEHSPYIVNEHSGKKVWIGKGGRKKDAPLEKFDDLRDSHWTNAADRFFASKEKEDKIMKKSVDKVLGIK